MQPNFLLISRVSPHLDVTAIVFFTACDTDWCIDGYESEEAYDDKSSEDEVHAYEIKCFSLLMMGARVQCMILNTLFVAMQVYSRLKMLQSFCYVKL